MKYSAHGVYWLKRMPYTWRDTPHIYLHAKSGSHPANNSTFLRLCSTSGLFHKPASSAIRVCSCCFITVYRNDPHGDVTKSKLYPTVGSKKPTQSGDHWLTYGQWGVTKQFFGDCPPPGYTLIFWPLLEVPNLSRVNLIRHTAENQQIPCPNMFFSLMFFSVNPHKTIAVYKSTCSIPYPCKPPWTSWFHNVTALTSNVISLGSSVSWSKMERTLKYFQIGIKLC